MSETFFYEKNNQVVMIDTGYLEYPLLVNKMDEIGMDPAKGAVIPAE